MPDPTAARQIAARPLTTIDRWYFDAWRTLTADARRPATSMEFALWLGRSTTAVYGALRRIEHAGYLRRDKRGRFHAAQTRR